MYEELCVSQTYSVDLSSHQVVSHHVADGASLWGVDCIMLFFMALSLAGDILLKH